MEKLKRFLVLPAPLAWVLSLLFGGGLVWIFLHGLDTRWYAYPVYVGAFYALTVDCVLLIPRIVVWAKRPRPPKKPNLRRDLSTQLLVDLIYGLWQIYQGVTLGSAWIGGYGIYNVCHGIVRAVLARYERRLRAMCDGGRKQKLAWRCYTICGCLMVALNLTMTGLVYQMIWMGRSSHYSEIMVIAVAAYTFYKLNMAVIRVVQCRRSNEPIPGAARNLGLAEAMMSLFSLQAALFAVYGEGFAQQHLMNSLTGFAVCLMTMLGGIGMIVHGIKRIKEVRRDEDGT